MVVRKKPDELSDVRFVVDVMGRCRAAVLKAQDQVKPLGPTDRMLRIVVVAIDAAATFLTGNETYYHAGGSAPSMEIGKWRDGGSPE